ncbi:Hypothetical predicted protein [Octopus vulgaris]|uniref:Uncharacterized protein n=1 Tax=Octopus vulgaris TaxID=6645 RepID=A0AA36FEL4_OCTVU|nr:Hypothetical predicted protein [Octopus vulgaris]
MVKVSRPARPKPPMSGAVIWPWTVVMSQQITYTVRAKIDKWTKEEYDTLIECHERAKLERSLGVYRRNLKFWMERDMCPMSENKPMNPVRVIRRKGYLTGVEISRSINDLRDSADGLRSMIGVENREVGVESREKSRQKEEGNGDGAVKGEKHERYTVNPDTVVGGHAGEMNQRGNELLEIQRRLTNSMNVPEGKMPMNMRRVDRSMINIVI